MSHQRVFLTVLLAIATALFLRTVLLPNVMNVSPLLNYGNIKFLAAKQPGNVTYHRETQRQRKSRLLQTCKSTRRSRIPGPCRSRLLVDERNKMLYCLPPKAGSSVVKRALGLISGKVSQNMLDAVAKQKGTRGEIINPSFYVVTRDFLRRVGLRMVHEVRGDLSDYYKVMVVRDPYARLYSAYKDKLTMHEKNTPGVWLGKYGLTIIKEYRLHVSKVARLTMRREDMNIKFEEFLQFVVDRYKENKDNIHWRSYQCLCTPCDIEYDTIAHVETLAKDMDYIFKHIFTTNYTAQQLLESNKGPHTGSGNATQELFSAYSKVSPRVLRYLHGIYGPDARMFGYDSV